MKITNINSEKFANRKNPPTLGSTLLEQISYKQPATTTKTKKIDKGETYVFWISPE